MGWIDSHCHLDSLDDLEGSIARARQAGLGAMVTVGTDLATSRQAVAHAETFDDVWAVVGVHPYDAKVVDGEMVGQLKAIADSVRVVAIGEIGMDLHHQGSDVAEQRSAFKIQLDLANEIGLPVVLHVRDAHDEAFRMLDSTAMSVPIIFHCFSGDASVARKALDLGGYLSFAGNVSYRSAGDLRDAAAIAPLDRLLVETDSPYLAPVPHRGRPNEPAYVIAVGAAVAEATGRSISEIEAATTANASLVFGHSGRFSEIP